MLRPILISLAVLYSTLAAIDPGQRLSLVCYISWYNELGAFNGTRAWKSGGWQYERLAEEGANHPTLRPASLPVNPPPVGSEAFARLNRENARLVQRRMKEAGFDVVAFDMLPMPDYDPKAPLAVSNTPFAHWLVFLEWLEAARDTGMKIALMPDVQNKSGDYPKGRTLSRDEWVKVLGAALDRVENHPALCRLDGKPTVIHFGTDVYYGGPSPVAGAPKPDGGWREVIAALHARKASCYFIADVRPHDLVLQWTNWADAVHLFAPAAPLPFLSEYQRDLSRALTVPLVWTLSPGYYLPRVAYTEPDFARFHQCVKAAVEAKAPFLYTLTWNDFGEDTDIVPSLHKGEQLLTVMRHYNAWFHTGKEPPAKEESVILAYPLALQAALATRSPDWAARDGAAATGERWKAPEYAPKVFYWANLKTTQRVAVEGVGAVELPPGVSMGSLGPIQAGPVSARWNGKTLALPEVAPKGGAENPRFQFVDLARPPAPSVKAVVAATTSIQEDFSAWPSDAAWQAQGRGGWNLSGAPEFELADNPKPEGAHRFSKCLRIRSEVNTEGGRLTIRFAPMTDGELSFKVYSPRRGGNGPPYGYATWSMGNAGGSHFHGDFMEYLDRVSAAYGDQEPFGGYRTVKLGALGSSWHTLRAKWGRDGRVSLWYDGVLALDGVPMRQELGKGLSRLSFGSAEVLEGNRDSDVYVAEISVKPIP
ncbi:MAG: hypothetical protein J0L75_17365 [Spirochaetes bacterium]|nr:hypothetical protein [Spirochaetota bacterium]